MLLPILRSCAEKSGLYIVELLGTRIDVYAHLGLGCQIEYQNFHLGQIRLQAIPDNHVLAFFSSEPPQGKKKVDLDNEGFNGFLRELFAQLIRLGFMTPPPEEKPPIGFRAENEP